MKLPTIVESPVKSWTVCRQTINVNAVRPSGETVSIPVRVFASQNKNGEVFLDGETCAYLDQVKANAMGLIDCKRCDKQEKCDCKMLNECIKKASSTKMGVRT